MADAMAAPEMATAASTVRSLRMALLTSSSRTSVRTHPTWGPPTWSAPKAYETDGRPGGVRACPERLADAAKVTAGHHESLPPRVPERLEP
jgi:hypothetical protein